MGERRAGVLGYSHLVTTAGTSGACARTVPPRSEAEAVRFVSHVLHIWEAIVVDDRAAVILVVFVSLRAIRAALRTMFGSA